MIILGFHQSELLLKSPNLPSASLSVCLYKSLQSRHSDSHLTPHLVCTHCDHCTRPQSPFFTEPIFDSSFLLVSPILRNLTQTGPLILVTNQQFLYYLVVCDVNCSANNAKMSFQRKYPVLQYPFLRASLGYLLQLRPASLLFSSSS